MLTICIGLVRFFSKYASHGLEKFHRVHGSLRQSRGKGFCQINSLLTNCLLSFASLCIVGSLASRRIVVSLSNFYRYVYTSCLFQLLNSMSPLSRGLVSQDFLSTVYRRDNQFLCSPFSPVHSGTTFLCTCFL